MSFTNLRAFIEQLRKEKQLIEITALVDPYLEIAEIHRRVIERQGPALLFTRVKNSPFPVVTNLFGTRRRVELAFGTKPEWLVKSIIDSLHQMMPPSISSIWRQRKLMLAMMRMGQTYVQTNRAPVMNQYKEKEPLAQLPAITSWQDDGGPFVTLPLVYTEHPHTGIHNLGMYRMHIFDSQTTGMHWQIHKGGGFHYHEAERLGKSLPVTVFLGGPPALLASAIAPLPENLPELLLTSFILGKKLALVEDPRGSLPLVAEAEFAIVGTVKPFERKPEGPFGDHYGYYSLQHDFPVFHTQHMWHRKDAIYPATIVGKPYQEDYYLGEFLQRLLSPVFPLVMPGVKDLWTYAETGFHPLAAAIVRESYRREAFVSAFRILGEGQLSLTKCLLVTDQTVDLQNFKLLLTRILERFDPMQDLRIISHTSQDTLDYTGNQLNHGSKVVWFGIGDSIRELPHTYEGELMFGINKLAPYCPGCLVVSGPTFTDEPQFAQQFLQNTQTLLQKWPLVFVVDDLSIINHQLSFLWTVFTRFNPATDIYASTHLQGHHIGYSLPIVIDARMKPGYPAELFPAPHIVDLVNRRWGEYFT